MGRVRVSLLAARRELGIPHEVPGDRDTLPERYAFKPITTAERFLVIGHVVWDEMARELAFNTVPGFLAMTREGKPVIMELSSSLFYNATSGQLVEFNQDCTTADIRTAAKITGPPASRLYRMMVECVVKDKQRWRKVFTEDPKAKG